MSNFDKFTGTRPVAPQHTFDPQRLAAWMREQGVTPAQAGAQSSGEIEVSQFKGGQSNPTYLVEAGGRRYVLRRKPPGKLLPSAHAVDREYRVMTALAKTDVPVPKTYALCEDPEVIGTAFFLCDFVDGRVLWDPTLPGLTNEQRAAHYAELNRVIAALHKVDIHSVGLDDYGKPGNYLARQIDRWSRQYRASETERIDAMDNLIEWLPAHIPPGDETAIVHGDYRIDNVIFHPTEPRILAVLDWELSTLGDPLADFSYHLMQWHMPHSDAGTGSLVGENLPALGIPQLDAYVDAYVARTGLDPRPHLPVYFAYNFFRIAAILQGIAGRVRDGTATSAHAAARAELVRPLAARGWEFASKA